MITEPELLDSGLLGFIEVINGQTQRLSANSYKQNLVANNIFKALQPFSADGILSQGHTSYALRRDQDRILTLRVPDVSYTDDTSPAVTVVLPEAPRLAIKVVADHETRDHLDTMVRDYLNAGTECFWLVYPECEELHTYNRRGHQRRYSRQETLTITEIFDTDVALMVADCFIYPWD